MHSIPYAQQQHASMKVWLLCSVVLKLYRSASCYQSTLLSMSCSSVQAWLCCLVDQLISLQRCWEAFQILCKRPHTSQSAYFHDTMQPQAASDPVSQPTAVSQHQLLKCAHRMHAIMPCCDDLLHCCIKICCDKCLHDCTGCAEG